MNIVKGTSYLFTVTLTGYTKDYVKNVKWSLGGKTLTAKDATWTPSTKTLKTIVDATGATAGATNNLKFEMTNDYVSSEITRPIEVSGTESGERKIICIFLSVH